jgi:hypothetical protein
MELGDILTKVGVGACFGFGIIVLAKLFMKKGKQDSTPPGSGTPAAGDSAGSENNKDTRS